MRSTPRSELLLGSRDVTLKLSSDREPFGALDELAGSQGESVGALLSGAKLEYGSPASSAHDCLGELRSASGLF